MLVTNLYGVWLVEAGKIASAEIGRLDCGTVMNSLFPPGRSNTLNKESVSNKICI